MFINFTDMVDSKIYITSDPHLGHNRDFVYGARGFVDVKSHDDAVIESFNVLARPNDKLIILGDLCLNTTLEQFDTYLARINCQNIYAIWGNHNNPHEKKIYFLGQPERYVRGIKVLSYPFEYKKLVFLPHYVEAALNNQFVILSHYPHFIWNEMSHGAWMLCGHSHYGCEFSKAENLNAKILDVGWDGHLGPWSLEEIKAVMDKKIIPVVDHHR
jgi:calcineurin-like phosphoesterase family protein